VIFIWLMTLMIAAQSYGVNMSAVLTLGGASAFALSFAFQDVFKNIFGGVVILLTRPFRVGDGITLVGKCISGSVERIGIYQTRIRGWDKIPCIIPNSVFLTDSVQNITGVTQRRIEFVIGLRYQDFSKIEPILAEIEAAVKAHDSVDQEGLLRVVFSDYADSSLNITIICMSVPDTDAGGGATIKQDLMLKVGRIVADHGADFAFPTQTLDFPVPVQVTSSSSS
jgi:MscS family membrane protein